MENKCQLWMETQDEDGQVYGQCAVVNIAEALMFSADNGALTTRVLQKLLTPNNAKPTQQQQAPQTKPKPNVADFMQGFDQMDDDANSDSEVDVENSTEEDKPNPFSLTNIFSKLRDDPKPSNTPPIPPPIIPVIPQNNGETSDSTQ